MSKAHKYYNTGIAYLACPMCRRYSDESDSTDSIIIMTKEFTKRAYEDVEKAKGKVVGYHEEPCDECQHHIKDGYMLLVEAERLDEHEHMEEITPDKVQYLGGTGYLKKQAAIDLEMFPDTTSIDDIPDMAFLDSKMFKAFVDLSNEVQETINAIDESGDSDANQQ